MELDEVKNQLIALKKADDQLRSELIKRGELFDGYHPEMEELHNANAEKLESIIKEIGYPTIKKVGEEANAAAWLIIQHAIAKPQFMKKCLLLLETAVNNNQAEEIHYAYLSDRIATFENRPQHYGTQFDWDKEGKLSPKPYDNIQEVNKRRKQLGLNSLEEQTIIMRKHAEKENQNPPLDFNLRTEQYDAWRKKVGWL